MGEAEKMRVGFVQFTPQLGPRPAQRTRINLASVERLLEAARPDADLMVLPELFATGYFFREAAEPAELAERAGDGPTTDALRRWAQRWGGTWVAGFVERGAGPEGDARWNSAIVAPPDGEIGVYRKVHLFYEEQRWFAPGDLGFPTFPLRARDGDTRFGVMICYDWRFPEAARALALGGAEVIAQPANLVHPHCQEAMRTRSLENGVFSVTANRGGEESNARETLRFTGGSQIVGPDGRVLARAADGADRVEIVTIDLARARDKRITQRNDIIRDRRPDQYRALTEPRPGG